MKKTLVVGVDPAVIEAIAPLGEWAPLFWAEYPSCLGEGYLHKPQHWQHTGSGKGFYAAVKEKRLQDFIEIEKSRYLKRRRLQESLRRFDDYFDYFAYILEHY